MHTRPMGEPSEVGLKGDIEYTQDNRVLFPSVCCSGPSASQSASSQSQRTRQTETSQTWKQAGWEAIAQGNSAGRAWLRLLGAQVVYQEVKENNFVKKRYIKQMHAISFAGQQYESEVAACAHVGNVQ